MLNPGTLSWPDSAQDCASYRISTQGFTPGEGDKFSWIRIPLQASTEPVPTPLHCHMGSGGGLGCWKPDRNENVVVLPIDCLIEFEIVS